MCVPDWRGPPRRCGRLRILFFVLVRDCVKRSTAPSAQAGSAGSRLPSVYVFGPVWFVVREAGVFGERQWQNDPRPHRIAIGDMVRPLS